jgi:hypothetical protein
MSVRKEEDVFFEDLSGQILQDDELARLLTISKCPDHCASGIPDLRSDGGNRTRLATIQLAEFTVILATSGRK